MDATPPPPPPVQRRSSRAAPTTGPAAAARATGQAAAARVDLVLPARAAASSSRWAWSSGSPRRSTERLPRARRVVGRRLRGDAARGAGGRRRARATPRGATRPAGRRGRRGGRARACACTRGRGARRPAVRRARPPGRLQVGDAIDGLVDELLDERATRARRPRARRGARLRARGSSRRARSRLRRRRSLIDAVLASTTLGAVARAPLRRCAASAGAWTTTRPLGVGGAQYCWDLWRTRAARGAAAPPHTWNCALAPPGARGARQERRGRARAARGLRGSARALPRVLQRARDARGAARGRAAR